MIIVSQGKKKQPSKFILFYKWENGTPDSISGWLIEISIHTKYSVVSKPRATCVTNDKGL